ncbi:kinase-like domain-containing protein [Rhizophagus irregularis DAOM 181602=DAOM 197198]|nr:kinase-like domain-containing protein [Rhizophagus irregularis DAOM 181602=DAOM 197198]
MLNTTPDSHFLQGCDLVILHHKVDDDFRITKLYGITQDPETENYVMVLKYANDGSLRKYLDTKYYELNWKSIFRHLDDIISGLNFIHEKELIHRDLHIGLRPRFNINVPQLIVQLIKRCLDANQLNRPATKEIINILRKWQYKESDSETAELQKQIKETEKINNNSRVQIMSSTSLGISYKPHSGAIYTSRLLSFNNLPESKNSDDYYEKNDNIISKEFSDLYNLGFLN